MADLQSRRIALAQDHPSFDGHFPGQPVLPGVVLLSEAIEVLLREVPASIGAQPKLSNIQFLAAVRPGAGLEVRWSGDARLRFEVWRHAEGDPPQGQLAASGQVERS